MEISQADKDRELSFSIVNYLSASYRGKLAGYTLLGQLEHSSFDPDDMTVIQSVTDRIADWLSGLTRGETLFSASWKTPETFEAQNALSLLTKLKPDIIEAANQIEDYLSGKGKIDSESCKLLFSYLIRSSFARDIYLRGFIIYGNTFNKPQIVKNYTNLLGAAVEHSKIIQQGLELFRQVQYDLSNLNPEFLNTLMSASSELPAIFRTHVHDINLLAANYSEATFANLDFSQEEANAWGLVGIDPGNAGYWRAYGFEPQKTIAWIQSFINNPAEALAWESSNFTPESALPWRQLGFPLEAALVWGDAGYSAQIAKENIDKGINYPPQDTETTAP